MLYGEPVLLYRKTSAVKWLLNLRLPQQERAGNKGRWQLAAGWASSVLVQEVVLVFPRPFSLLQPGGKTILLASWYNTNFTEAGEPLTCTSVLSSAGMGLISTRTQERTQRRWLTQTVQRGYSDTMRRHALFRVGELTRGRLIIAWENTGHQAVRKLSCVFPCFVYSFSRCYYC